MTSIPILPARTEVKAWITGVLPTGECEFDIRAYHCIDCGFSSANVQDLIDHQNARRKLFGPLKHWWERRCRRA